MEVVCVCHISRNQNMVAHTLAIMGLVLDSPLFKDGNNVPSSVCTTVEADLASP